MHSEEEPDGEQLEPKDGGLEAEKKDLAEICSGSDDDAKDTAL